MSGAEAPVSDLPRLRPWLRGCLLLVAVLAVGVSCVPVVFWDGGYRPARYDVRVVDGEGRPVAGATLRVRGPARESHDAPPGSWPIHEWRGEPLVADESGSFGLHQPDSGIQFGGTTHYVLGLIPVSIGRPSFELEVSAPGYDSVRVPFEEWDRRARSAAARKQAEWDPAFRAILRLVDIEILLTRS